MSRLDIKQLKGLTGGSILFVESNNSVNENNDKFFWDQSNYRLAVGTNSPSATLHIQGDFRLVDGSQASGYILMSDSTGLSSWTSSTALGIPTELNDLSDVNITTATLNDTLRYDELFKFQVKVSLMYEKIQNLIEIARYAPTGKNSQQVGWLVVEAQTSPQ